MVNYLILFLDIDGVLNSHKYLKENDLEDKDTYFPQVDPARVQLIKELCDKVPSLRIVMNSSWNATMKLSDYQEMFSKYNLSPDKLIDCTRDDLDKDLGIEDWLKKHLPTNFVILDDDMIYDHDNQLSFHQVKTSFYIGLKADHIPVILELLHHN